MYIIFNINVVIYWGFLLNAERNDNSGQSKGLKVTGREGNFIKLGKIRSGSSDSNPKSVQGRSTDACETAMSEHTQTLLGRSIEGSAAAVGPVRDVTVLRSDKVYSSKKSQSRTDLLVENNDDNGQIPVSHSLPKDSKPMLKFKFKKPSVENQNSPLQEEEKSSIKGQRSKRKRPSPLADKISFKEEDDVAPSQQDNLMDEIMDANWILKKLGKDAIGKRVEVQQPSDNSW